MKKLIKTILERWKNKMPKFFKVLSWICGLISGTAIAVNTALMTANVTPHEWWNDIVPYLIGVPAGMLFACKFTVNGGYQGEKEEEKESESEEARDSGIWNRLIKLK